MISGGQGARTLRAAARYAREWNVSGKSAGEFSEKSSALTALLGSGRQVNRSVQVYLRSYPDRSPRVVVDEFAAAGAERVVLVLDPPYKPGVVTRLGREGFG